RLFAWPRLFLRAGTLLRDPTLPRRQKGSEMRKSMLGVGVYIAVACGVIGGGYAAFSTMIGNAPSQAGTFGDVKHGPGVLGPRKWTPVEIKRAEVQHPPLAAYMVPSNAERARIAKSIQKRAVVAAQPNDQRVAAYIPAEPAYAPTEPPRSFGPFGFKF
ncbi:MAG: hypothetical protein WCG92_16240, partial [Hyphomicrobiales bacterium]